MGKKVLNWLEAGEVYSRVQALQSSLCFEEGEAKQLVNISEQGGDRSQSRPERLEQRFPRHLRDVIGTWAREWTVNRWRKKSARCCNDGPDQLSAEDFRTFVRYVSDYLCCDEVFSSLEERLRSIVTLPIRDEGDKRQAVREYVRVVLENYVMNPGPNAALLEPIPDDYGDKLALMRNFVRRWRGRLPLALASAAGAHTAIPPGNDELQQLLAKYDRS